MALRTLPPAGWVAVAVAALPLGFYSMLLGLGMTTFFQRHFLYAHKIQSSGDLTRPERWGFAQNQVTPLSLDTPDGETLFGWHILPLPLYLQNEARIAQQEPSVRFEASESFKLLREDPEARLVLYFHGNAGHVAQAHRPQTYHSLTDTSSYHVVAIDYRGFGLSTGSPSEEGLITDAAALVTWALDVAEIPPERIVMLGQSLGTAVATAAFEKFTARGVRFGGLILVAGFSELPTMLSEYKMGGVVPALGPIKRWPALLAYFQSCIEDKWKTADRLASIMRMTVGGGKGEGGGSGSGSSRLRLQFLHAADDGDIPSTEDDRMFSAVVNATREVDVEGGEFGGWKEEKTVRKGEGSFVTEWRYGEDVVVRQELVPFGGHNRVMMSAPVALAVMRAFDLHGTTYS